MGKPLEVPSSTARSAPNHTSGESMAEQETAAQAFRRATKRAQEAIDAAQKELDASVKEFAAKQGHWDYVGSMNQLALDIENAHGVARE